VDKPSATKAPPVGTITRIDRYNNRFIKLLPLFARYWSKNQLKATPGKKIKKI
jgi:hypothetical protein